MPSLIIDIISAVEYNVPLAFDDIYTNEIQRTKMEQTTKNKLNICVSSFAETEALGMALGKRLMPGDVIALHGELGAGKTTLVRGIARGLDIEPRLVHSPTFILLHAYEGPRLTLYHFDAYRLDNDSSFEELGFEEFIEGGNVAVIEWAERIPALLPKQKLEIYLEITGENSRKIMLNASFGKEYLLDLKKT